MKHQRILALAVLLSAFACQRPYPPAPAQASNAEQPVGAPVVGAPARVKETTATFTTPDGATSTFRLEIAETMEERLRGLMHRREMARDRGMLFLFPVEEERVFYMKNTYIPLDMVFLSSSRKVVSIVENARPLTLDDRSSGVPARYVIELNAFVARDKRIVPGTAVSFEPQPPDVTD